MTTLVPLPELRTAAWVVLELRPHDHETPAPALCELQWLPIMQRIEFKLCLLVHKTLDGRSPQLSTVPVDTHHCEKPVLWMWYHSDLIVPCTHRTFRERVFSGAAPTPGLEQITEGTDNYVWHQRSSASWSHYVHYSLSSGNWHQTDYVMHPWSTVGGTLQMLLV